MDMTSLFKQAQEMQQKMAKIQEELGQQTVTGSAGGGMVFVTANGRGEVVSVTIEKAAIVPSEAEMLQDLIAAATNDALRRAKELNRQAMGRLTGGINIPGLSSILS